MSCVKLTTRLASHNIKKRCWFPVCQKSKENNSIKSVKIQKNGSFKSVKSKKCWFQVCLCGPDQLIPAESLCGRRRAAPSVFQDGIWTNIEIHWRYISKQQLNYFSFSHRGIYFCTPCFTLVISVLPLSLSYLKADLVLSLLGVALDGVGRRHRRRVDVAVIRHDQTVAPVVHLQTGQVYLYLCFSAIYYR